MKRHDKKLFAFLLTLIMALTPILAISVFADGPAVISAGNASVDLDNDTQFTLDINIANNPKFYNLGIELTYDTSAFKIKEDQDDGEYTAVSLNSDVLNGGDVFLNPAGNKIIWTRNNGSKANDGRILSLTFDVLPGAMAGEYPVSVALIEGIALQFADLGGALDVTFESGTIMVTGGTPSEPEVTSVSVTPTSATVAKGAVKQFSKSVVATGGAAETVTWSVIGSVGNASTIDTSGQLHVGASETATTLTVRATSTVNTDIYGEATVTVTEANLTNGYTVSLSTDDAYVGVEDGVLAVKVNVSGEDQLAGFSANIEYDANVLQFVSAIPDSAFNPGAPTQYSVAPTTGAVSILRNGDAVAEYTGAEYAAVTLNFKVISTLTAPAENAVTLKAAGASEYKPDFEAVGAANLGDSSITVFPVDSDVIIVKFVTGNGAKFVGTDVTEIKAYAKQTGGAGLWTTSEFSGDADFTIPTTEAKDGYRLDAAKIWYDGSAYYTQSNIPTTYTVGKTFTAYAIKTFTVEFFADGTQIGDTQIIDTGLTPDDVPANPDAPAGSEFKGWFVSTTSAPTYTSQTLYSKSEVESRAITEDTVYKAYFEGQEFSITLPDGVIKGDGITGTAPDLKVKNGVAAKFTLDSDIFDTDKNWTVSYTVGGGSGTALTAVSGTYTIDGDLIGGDIVVSVTETLADIKVELVDNDEYIGLQDGKQLLVVEIDSPDGDMVYLYGGSPMYKVAFGDNIGKYVYIIDENESANDAALKITAVAKTETELRNIEVGGTGLIRGGGRIEPDVVDAQIVYALYKGEYATDALSDRSRLEADVNGSGSVGTEDVVMIYAIIRGEI